MKRHRLDVVALIIGLAFVMYGAGFLVNEITGNDFNAGSAAALGLVTLGVVALLVTLLRPKRELNDAASAAQRSELAGARASSEPGIPASSESDKGSCEGDKEL